LDQIEKQTYRFHVRAILFEGVFGGLMWSTGEIARKALGVDTLLLTLIVMAPSVSMGAVLFFGNWISRTGPRRLLRRAATLGRLPMLLVGLLLVPSIGDWWRTESGKELVPWLFLVLVTIQALASVPITAAWNGVLRGNYTDENRGSLFGHAQRWGSLLSGIGTLGAGVWLHYNSDAFPWLYIIAAIAGWAACFIFSRVPLRSREKSATDAPKIDSARALWRILSRDRRFLTYEIGFILYGTGFMALVTAKPIWTVDAEFLNLSWPVLLGTKGLVSLAAVILTPYFGKMLDRIGPGWLSGGAYSGLVLYAILLAVADSTASFIVAEIVFGISMSAVILAWNVGPISFASINEGREYMAVHVALVCVRGLIGHPIGGFLSEATGDPRYVFGFSMVLWVIAAAVMFSLGKGPARRESELPLA
jgi:MFS family permease